MRKDETDISERVKIKVVGNIKKVAIWQKSVCLMDFRGRLFLKEKPASVEFQRQVQGWHVCRRAQSLMPGDEPGRQRLQ